MFNNGPKIDIRNKGDGNTYNVVQIIAKDDAILSQTIGFLGLENIFKTNEAIGSEFISENSNVLLCYPNKEYKDLEPIIRKIKDGLAYIGAVVFEGSGKIPLPDVGGYPHIAEIDFIKKLKCDSIIIFVLDELTLSQLTLISYYKVESNIKNVDIIAIPSDDIYNYDDFLSNGLIQYCDDNDCKVIKLSALDDMQVEKLIQRVRNKKIIQKRSG